MRKLIVLPMLAAFTGALLGSDAFAVERLSLPEDLILVGNMAVHIDDPSGHSVKWSENCREIQPLIPACDRHSAQAPRGWFLFGLGPDTFFGKGLVSARMTGNANWLLQTIRQPGVTVEATRAVIQGVGVRTRHDSSWPDSDTYHEFERVTEMTIVVKREAYDSQQRQVVKTATSYILKF